MLLKEVEKTHQAKLVTSMLFLVLSFYTFGVHGTLYSNGLRRYGYVLIGKRHSISKVVTTRTQFACTLPCAARNACIGDDAVECLNISYLETVEQGDVKCKLSVNEFAWS